MWRQGSEQGRGGGGRGKDWVHPGCDDKFRLMKGQKKLVVGISEPRTGCTVLLLFTGEVLVLAVI